MNKKNVWLLGALASAVLLGMSFAVKAQEPVVPAHVENVEPGAQAAMEPASSAIEEPVFKVLDDKLHHFDVTLANGTSEHYYGFTSLRGQDVLLKLHPPFPLKVERYDSGEWKRIQEGNTTIKDLKPGEDVIVRVTQLNPARPFTGTSKMSFGSYPVLRSFKLNDEKDVVRMTMASTEPEWFSVQAYTNTMLDVEFADTVGVPLEGGKARFGFVFGNGKPHVPNFLETNSSGKASETYHFARCEGGIQARDFINYSRGYNNIWRSYYKIVKFYVTNDLVDKSIDHFYEMAQICEQKLVSSRRS